MSKDVILLSGGVDSAYLTMNMDRGCIALFVDYGQPSCKSEYKAAKNIADKSNCEFRTIEVAGMPLGDMGISKENSGPQIVPARNLWLIAMAAGHSTNGAVWIGAAPQDHADYPDCRQEFLSTLRMSMKLIGVELCWSDANREKRINALRAYGIMELTHSCYSNVPCGKCQSCLQQ